MQFQSQNTMKIAFSEWSISGPGLHELIMLMGIPSYPQASEAVDIRWAECVPGANVRMKSCLLYAVVTMYSHDMTNIYIYSWLSQYKTAISPVSNGDTTVSSSQGHKHIMPNWLSSTIFSDGEVLNLTIYPFQCAILNVTKIITIKYSINPGFQPANLSLYQYLKEKWNICKD